MQQEINDTKEAIDEANLSVLELSNSIRDLEWEIFDYIEDRISQITSESDFLIDLLSNSDLYDDRGQLTDEGLSTMGLHGVNYNTYMAQADQYAQELLEIEEELADDPYDQDLIERKEELLQLQQEMILAAEEEKQAIVDLVEEGIEIELNSLKELIDAYEDSLDSAKDLYEYQKNIEEQTSNIASLQKQLSAYENDTSEEAKATVQKLKVELESAQSDLEETEYEQYISDQKKLLDDLYDEYESILNERLDDVDALISDMIDTINLNSDTISETLTTAADNVGYTLSDNMTSIWDNSTTTLTGVITQYGTDFSSALTSVNETLSSIQAYVAAMVQESETEAESIVSSTTTTTAATKTTSSSSSSSTSTKTTSSSSSSSTNFSDDIKKGVAAAIWIYGSSKSGWGTGSTRKSRLTSKFGSTNASAVQSYINSHGSNGDLYKYWVNTGKSSLSKYYYSAFKTGGLADYTGMAWMDGTKTNPELVLNAQDTENFLLLKDALSSLVNGGVSTDSYASVLEGIIPEITSLIEAAYNGSGNESSFGGTNNNYTVNFENLVLPNVQNYEEFMNKMREDNQFEKMVQAMTINKAVGGSSLEKNKYRW